MRFYERLMFVSIACLTLNVMAEDPVISNVTVRQRWPWSRLVDIDYVLTCAATQKVDIAVSAFNDVTELALPLSSLSGDLYNVSYGARRIVWDPTVTAYTNAGVLGNFRVTLAPTQVPLYMIVDLTKDVGANGQIAYVYESDLRAGSWGSWVENPVTNKGTPVQSVIWTGVTNDPAYATDKLVLRRIPAGTFGMGDSTSISTTLTKPFYMGVFAVTDAQWNRALKVSGGTSKPKNALSYDDIRGATNSVPSIDWPTTGSRVSPTNFIGQLRAATGVGDFDMPTDAQWEYACRAGTTTVYNDGDVRAKYDGTEANNNGDTNSYLNALGWYQFNCNNTVQPVGLKAANAWGLYDMHGNVMEWCLNWNGGTLGGVDPVGANSNEFLYRVFRGGNYGYIAKHSRSAWRDYYYTYSRGNSRGVRVVRMLP